MDKSTAEEGGKHGKKILRGVDESREDWIFYGAIENQAGDFAHGPGDGVTEKAGRFHPTNILGGSRGRK
jgi:hypothetical protein